jgi:hypothetical protein
MYINSRHLNNEFKRRGALRLTRNTFVNSCVNNVIRREYDIDRKLIFQTWYSNIEFLGNQINRDRLSV